MIHLYKKSLKKHVCFYTEKPKRTPKAPVTSIYLCFSLYVLLSYFKNAFAMSTHFIRRKEGVWNEGGKMGGRAGGRKAGRTDNQPMTHGAHLATWLLPSNRKWFCQKNDIISVTGWSWLWLKVSSMTLKRNFSREHRFNVVPLRKTKTRIWPLMVSIPMDPENQK